jgi:hypothetical protein
MRGYHPRGPFASWDLRVEFNKAVYRVGEPIKVRFLVTNKGMLSRSMAKLPPWGLCGLAIIRVGGESLPTDGFVGTPGRWYVWDFRPGETKVVSYEDPQGRRREWTDIRYWGYRAMTPGDYETNIGLNHH